MSGTNPPSDSSGGPSRGTRSLTDRTLNSFFWVFAGGSVQALLKISVTIVLARLLSPAEFGVVGAALVVIGFSQIFSQLGVGPAVIQHPDLTDTHLKVAFTLSLAMGVLTGLLIYLSAPLISNSFRIAELEPVLRVLACLFPIASLGVVGEGVLRREMRFKQLSGIEVLAFAFGYGIVGILCAWRGWGVWALVTAQITQTIFQTLLIVKVGTHPKALCFERNALKQLLRFATGFSLAKIGNYVAVQADNFVVARWLGAEALGLYGRAYQFMMMPADLFGKVIDSVLFPSMAVVQKDAARLGRAYLRAFGIMAMITLPASGVLVILAPEIILVLLGAHWVGVIAPFQIFAAVLFFRTSYKVSDSVVRATGAVYSRAWRQWVYAAVVFLGSCAGALRGLNGVAMAVSFAVLLNFVLMLHLSTRLVSITWSALAKVFLRHSLISLPVILASWLFVFFGRNSALPDWLTISGALASAAFAVMICWFLLGRLYGEEGDFIAQTLRNRTKTLNFGGRPA